MNAERNELTTVFRETLNTKLNELSKRFLSNKGSRTKWNVDEVGFGFKHNFSEGRDFVSSPTENTYPVSDGTSPRTENEGEKLLFLSFL